MTYEWSVFVTDCLLAVAFFFSARLVQQRVNAENFGAQYVIVALMAGGVSAAVGGFRHGFGPIIPPNVYHALWLASYVGIVFSGSLLLLGITQGTVPRNEHRQAFLGLCTAKFATFAGFLIVTEEAWLVAMSWGFDVIVIGYVGLLLTARRQQTLGLLLAGGSAISAFAALIQRGWIVGTASAMHNDLFHLLMIPAVLCYASAALLFRDRTNPAS